MHAGCNRAGTLSIASPTSPCGWQKTKEGLPHPALDPAPLPAAQAPVRLHAYGVGRGVDREELLRIISASDPETAEDRCVSWGPGFVLACQLFCEVCAGVLPRGAAVLHAAV